MPRIEVPEHVLRAFQLDGEGQATSAAWDNGARFRRVVVAPATPAGVWSAKVRERIAPGVDGVRISRPVRATDGRFVVSGFAANEFVEGAPAARVDEVVAVSLRIDAALAAAGTPNPEPARHVWREMDKAVWAGEEMPVEAVVADLDLLRRCLFDGYAAPAVAALTPSADVRPRGYTAAVVMVDGLLAGAVDDRVVNRWAHIPNLRHLLVKALEFRKLTAPRSNVVTDFERIASIVSP